MIKVKPVIFEVETTQYWRQEWRDRRGITQVFEKFVADDNRRIHICSFTRSIEAWWVDEYIVCGEGRCSEEAQQEFEDNVYANLESVKYFTERGFPPDSVEYLEEIDLEELGVEYEEFMEDLAEGVRANG